MEKEIRSLTATLRKVSESRRVEGYAAVFDKPSVLFSDEWDEVMVKGCIDEDCIKRSVVLALMNHDESRGALARSKYGKGSLELKIDDEGLFFAFDAPNTPLGDELLEAIDRRDIDSCSFAFRVEDAQWEDNDGKYRRFVIKIKELYDISPVYNPAYQDTNIAKRNLDEVKQEEVKPEPPVINYRDYKNEFHNLKID
jgi:phage prohead protease, HK97 family